MSEEERAMEQLLRQEALYGAAWVLYCTYHMCYTVQFLSGVYISWWNHFTGTNQTKEV